MKLTNCSIYELCELVHERNIICIGAGKVFKDFISVCSHFRIEKQIIAVADNNKEIVGKTIMIVDKQIPVISVNGIEKISNIVIIITCADIAGIYEQLNNVAELKDTLCFAANYIKSETSLYDDKLRKYPSSYRVTEKMCIPKKIHYCWFGRNPLPEKNKKWMESWKAYCPDYEIIEWNEDNYDVTQNAYMHEAYKAGKWAFVSDYARMDIIYKHGGIYFDTDVEVIRNLDDLLYQHAFVGVETASTINIGLGLGAEQSCAFIKEMRDMYCELHFVKEDGTFDLTSQPARQADFFKKKGYVPNGDYQILENITTVYPEKVLSPKCMLTGRILTTDNTFTIHHYDASWLSKDGREIFEKRIELFKSITKI